ncbi:MAG TPA: hypothetical protein P5186_06200 [Candidatus Paceibacterota bacterium]|nr:hypothetical protein [Candidatus Paceibacterota bacterium]
MTTKPFPSEILHIRLEEPRRRPETPAEQPRATAKEAGQRRLKGLHWMHCPKCGQRLATEHCGAVEIDVCPCC